MRSELLGPGKVEVVVALTLLLLHSSLTFLHPQTGAFDRIILYIEISKIAPSILHERKRRKAAPAPGDHCLCSTPLLFSSSSYTFSSSVGAEGGKPPKLLVDIPVAGIGRGQIQSVCWRQCTWSERDLWRDQVSTAWCSRVDLVVELQLACRVWRQGKRMIPHF